MKRGHEDKYIYIILILYLYILLLCLAKNVDNSLKIPKKHPKQKDFLSLKKCR
jgi:hypothetical protein